MTDAIIGAEYKDHTVGMKCEVVGTYERAVRGPHGEIKDTEVVVDVQYEGHQDPIRVELNDFKTDPGMELVHLPEWLEGK